MNNNVSIITPVYNAEASLVRTIESVVSQTYSAWELLLVNDCSTDNSSKIARGYAGKYPNIHLLENEANSGPAKTRNRGISEATGRYIAFLDSDDSWKPEKLESQINFMKKTGALFTYGDYTIVDKKTGKKIASIDIPEMLMYKDLLRSCPIGCLTAAYDQSKLGKVFMPDIRQGQDWGLWLALTRNGLKAYKYPGTEADYYVGGDSLSANKLQKGLNMYRIYREEEQLNIFTSFWYLMRHTWYVMNKKVPV